MKNLLCVVAVLLVIGNLVVAVEEATSKESSQTESLTSTKGIAKQLENLGSQINRLMSRLMPSTHQWETISYPFSERQSEEIKPLFEDFQNYQGLENLLKTDIVEHEDKWTLHVELPGVKLEDIQLELKNHVLSLKAERRKEEESKNKSWYKKEIYRGTIKRSYTLPTGIQSDAIVAEYKDGVLDVIIPKAEEAQPKTAIPIKVKG